MSVFDGENYISNPKYIRLACGDVFKEKYAEVQCAYLFGSYARGEATGKSDINIMVVCPPLGMRFYAIATDLEERLHKTIDLHTHRQLMENEKLLEAILKKGTKIYE